MPVPLPALADTDLEPPEPPEILHIARGVMTAIAPPEGLTRLQSLCLRSLSDAMTGHPLDLAQVTPISARRPTPKAWPGGTGRSGSGWCR